MKKNILNKTHRFKKRVIRGFCIEFFCLIAHITFAVLLIADYINDIGFPNIIMLFYFITTAVAIFSSCAVFVGIPHDLWYIAEQDFDISYILKSKYTFIFFAISLFSYASILVIAILFKMILFLPFSLVLIVSQLFMLVSQIVEFEKHKKGKLTREDFRPY